MTGPKTPDDNVPSDPVRVRNDEPEVENFNSRPHGTVIDTIVIHADAGKKAQPSVDWIKDDDSDVSYHTLVERDGDIHRLVAPEKRAWHAGKSVFHGKGDVNNFSLGLAFANRNDGVEEYTEMQLQVGAAEAAHWIRGHPGITMERITTHAIVATPPGRKTDPGPKFDMEKFKRYVQQTLDGIGVG